MFLNRFVRNPKTNRYHTIHFIKTLLWDHTVCHFTQSTAQAFSLFLFLSPWLFRPPLYIVCLCGSLQFSFLLQNWDFHVMRGGRRRSLSHDKCISLLWASRNSCHFWPIDTNKKPNSWRKPKLAPPIQDKHDRAIENLPC